MNLEAGPLFNEAVHAFICGEAEAPRLTDEHEREQR